VCLLTYILTVSSPTSPACSCSSLHRSFSLCCSRLALERTSVQHGTTSGSLPTYMPRILRSTRFRGCASDLQRQKITICQSLLVTRISSLTIFCENEDRPRLSQVQAPRGTSTSVDSWGRWWHHCRADTLSGWRKCWNTKAAAPLTVVVSP
jgi:hypothetical protein